MINNFLEIRYVFVFLMYFFRTPYSFIKTELKFKIIWPKYLVLPEK